ncbi:MAG: biopolymer transporter ExbD [Bauldia sp.]
MLIRPPDEADDLPESHEINVTPLIDVMLVLLIVFMVAAPLATMDVSVSLPSAGGNAAVRQTRPVMVTMRADRTVVFGGQELAPAALAPALDAKFAGDRSDPVYLLADRSIPYGEVMALTAAIKNAGYRVSLVTGAARE